MIGKIRCLADRALLRARGVPYIHIPANIGRAEFRRFTGREMCPECQLDDTRECDVCAPIFWSAFEVVAAALPPGGEILLCAED